MHHAIVCNVMPTTTDPHPSKALPGKIDYERLSPYFAFQPHDEQNLPFITLCEGILKVGFKC